jgi:ABC-2 type transport system permease protein
VSVTSVDWRAPRISAWNAIVAITRRDVWIERSYQLRLVLRVIGIFFFAATLFFVSDLVRHPKELNQYSGNYFDFVVVGLAVVSFATVGLRSFNQALANEQAQGTLEMLLTTPTPVPTLLAGALVVPLCIAALQVALLVGVGVGIVGVGFSLEGVLLSVPLFALTFANFCAMGIFSACFTVIAKRGDPISGPLAQATSFLAGALFPVSLLPGPLEVLAHAFPAFYGIHGIREALLTHAGITDVLDDTGILLAFAIVLVPLSLWVFSRSVRVARATGTLGTY